MFLAMVKDNGKVSCSSSGVEIVATQLMGGLAVIAETPADAVVNPNCNHVCSHNLDGEMHAARRSLTSWKDHVG